MINYEFLFIFSEFSVPERCQVESTGDRSPLLKDLVVTVHASEQAALDPTMDMSPLEVRGWYCFHAFSHNLAFQCQQE